MIDPEVYGKELTSKPLCFLVLPSSGNNAFVNAARCSALILYRIVERFYFALRLVLVAQ